MHKKEKKKSKKKEKVDLLESTLYIAFHRTLTELLTLIIFVVHLIIMSSLLKEREAWK